MTEHPAGAPLRDSVRIASLHIYPVKGCRAIDLEHGALLATGLQGDRQWMFVDDAGRFLSQRECAGLALIDVELAPGELVLRAAGHPPLRCPAGPSADEEDGATVRVSIWKDNCLARASVIDTRDWLERVTGVRGQLVRGIRAHARVCDPAFTGGDVGQALFPDAFSLLITSTASLAALNARLPQPLPMNRFRPNVVLEETAAFDEDRMTWLRAGAIALKCVKPCLRCIVTTTDQRTGERCGEEPLRTLRQFRFLPALKGVAFGMNAIVTAGMGGELAVGRRLAVTWHPRSEPDRWTFRAAGGASG